MGKFTDEQIIKIYNEDYIGKHMGGPALGKKYNCNHYYFYEAFKRLKLNIRNNQDKNRKYYCNSDYFETIDTEEKAYWLGFLYADGYISNPKKNNNIKRVGISIQERDFQHLEKFRKAISSDIPIHHYEVKQGYHIGSKYCRIIISDNKMAEDLIFHGCIEHKSNIIGVPIGIPKDLERHFIRGFMDGNGSISINNSKYGLSYKIRFTSTDNVLKWIMNHLIKYKIIDKEYPLYKRKPTHIVSSFEFGGNNLAKKYLDYIYEDATIWLDRKHDRYIELLNLIKQKEEKKHA